MPITDRNRLDAYAQMAEQAYINSPNSTANVVLNAGSGISSTYTEYDQEINAFSGFQVRAFFNQQLNEVVIAYAGTEGAPGNKQGFNPLEFLQDLTTNVGLATIGDGLQVAQAEMFANQVLNSGLPAGVNITYVGHSLGGFLAQSASLNDVATSNVPEADNVVVFNSPGVGGFGGVPVQGALPQDKYTYVYSPSSTWGALDGAIHSIGRRLSDNVLVVENAEGHTIAGIGSNPNGISDVLPDSAVNAAGPGFEFANTNEILAGITGAAATLLTFQELQELALDTGAIEEQLDMADATPDPVLATEGNDLINGTSGTDAINGMGGNDTINGNGGDDALAGGAGNDTLNGGSGNDLLEGNDGNDLLRGGNGNDALNGGAGVDRLEGGSGNDGLNGMTGDDLIIGGGGLDRAFVLGNRTANSVARDGNSNFNFTANSNHGTDDLRGVERIHYSDGRIALDIHGGREEDNGRAGYIYRLYETVLDRGPDINGLTSWVDIYTASNGPNYIGVANNFLGSQEFNNKYAAFRNGAADTNAEFVEYLYDAAFDRTANQSEINNWVSQLNGGTARGEVAGKFAGSQELRNDVFADVKDGIWLDSFPAGVSSFRFASTSKDGASQSQDSNVPSGYSENGPTLDTWFDLSTAQLVERFGDAYDRSLEGTDGADRLTGSGQADLIAGGDGNDALSGGRGNDRLIGGDGDDTLNGQRGQDILDGGSGDNVLRGGGGDDVFLFAFDFDVSHDTIRDFQSGSDQVQIDWLSFSDLTITDSDQGAVVTYNNGETITFRGVDAVSLSENDFILAAQVVPAESTDPFISF